MRNIWSRRQFLFPDGKSCQIKWEESSRRWDEGAEPDLPNLPAWNGRSQCSHQPQAPKNGWDVLWEGTKDTARCHRSRQGRCPDTAPRVCHRLPLNEHRVAPPAPWPQQKDKADSQRAPESTHFGKKGFEAGEQQNFTPTPPWSLPREAPARPGFGSWQLHPARPSQPLVTCPPPHVPL